MSIPTTQHAPAVEQSLPAWGMSLFLHLSAIALFGFMLRPWSPGSANLGDPNAFGMVLTHDRSAGDVRNGDGGEGDTPRLAPITEPPELVATPTTSTPELRDDPYVVRTAPVRLAAAPAAAPADAAPASRPTAGFGRSGSPGGTGYAKTSVFGV